MQTLASWRRALSSDPGTLWLAGAGFALLHVVVNGHYGFHRDELLSFDNAQHLAWGYVVYPPVTAVLARVELVLFGTSLSGFRLFPAITQGILFVLAGLIARELGGKHEAQLVAGVAVAIGGPCLYSGSSLSYTTFDYLWWVVVAYFVAKLLRTQDARWWVAVGAAIGLGMLTKYTMGFLVLGVVGGMLLTSQRHWLKSAWFWSGVAVALLLMLPNGIWQAQHEFVSIAYMKSIHTRDIGWGWTDFFVLNQLWKTTNIVTVPLWGVGLWFLFATHEGERYRMLGWMYVFAFAALFAARGRDYYLAPAYPMLLAAGAVWGERWVSSLSERAARIARRVAWRSMLVSGCITAALTMPVAPLGSAWWRIADAANGNFNMEVGWPDIAATVAGIRNSLPAEDRASLGILAGDEGVTGAINLYGRSYGLPTAISGMNSNWMRGYGNPPPETVIALELKRDFLDRNFASCAWAGRLTNPYGIVNFTIRGYEDVYVCRHLLEPWPEFWKHFRYYG